MFKRFEENKARHTKRGIGSKRYPEQNTFINTIINLISLVQMKSALVAQRDMGESGFVILEILKLQVKIG